MNCKGTVEMLSAYLDRELAPVERDAVRAHLADCERCRAEERDLRTLKGLLLGVRAPEPAEDFERRLMIGLREEASRPVRRRIELPRMRPTLVTQFGGLAAAFALAFVVIRTPSGETSRTSTAERPHQIVAQNVDLDLYAQRGEAYEEAGDYTNGAPLLMPNPDVP